jgi:hypothetical protein
MTDFGKKASLLDPHEIPETIEAVHAIRDVLTPKEIADRSSFSYQFSSPAAPATRVG